MRKTYGLAMIGLHRNGETMREGDGLRLMNPSGAFRFRVDEKESDWNIRVIQLNREEAKLYRPKN